MNRFEFYKEQYNNENSKRIELNESLSIPIAIITALGVAVYTYITSYSYYYDSLSYLFIILNVVSASLLIIAIIYLILSYTRLFRSYDYIYLPYLDSIERYYQQLAEQYQDAVEEQQGLENYELENTLIERYVECCTINAKLNEQKSSHLVKGKRFIVFSLIAIIFTLIPYLFNYFSSSEKIQKVKIHRTN